MKQIHYRIFKGEKSSVTKIPIPENLFKILNVYIPYISLSNNNLLSKEVLNEIGMVEGKIMDLHFDIIYNILKNTIGIESGEIENLVIEDYQYDKIIVHVYLDMI